MGKYLLSTIVKHVCGAFPNRDKTLSLYLVRLSSVILFKQNIVAGPHLAASDINA